jgi:capsular polysaccharide transport system permease protein
MHGITHQPDRQNVSGTSLVARARSLLWSNRNFLLVVVLPTLLVIAYFGLIAADQYESEAQFQVRAADAPRQQNFGLSAMGLDSAPPPDAISVSEYLSSHDAVAWLRRHRDLVARFRRPEADIFSRLWSPNPTPEALHRFYERQVTVKIDTETNLVILRVRGFRPTDSYALASALLGLGERRVNELNARMNNAALALARKQLAEAEEALTGSQRAITAFRQQYNNVDPPATSGAQLELVTKLKGALAQARAERSSMARFLDASSPQLVAVDARVRAIAAQVGAAQDALSGEGNKAIAARIGDYQELQLRQGFASKRYEAAAAQYQKARTDIERQQMYIVPVVDPNMPVKATYPQSLRVVLTVFISLLLVYGIGWLIIAGVREHAA